MLRVTGLIGIAAVMVSVTGCTWQQAYSASQNWQRSACNRLIEQTERERCLSNTNMSYDDYRRQTEEAKKGQWARCNVSRPPTTANIDSSKRFDPRPRRGRVTTAWSARRTVQLPANRGSGSGGSRGGVMSSSFALTIQR